jgi:hypothetical protein
MISLFKQKLDIFLKWLAKGGNDAFGDSRADCCQLNKKSVN